MLEAEQLCDRIALINQGKIIAIGTAKELKKLSGNQNATMEEAFLKLTSVDLSEEEDE